MTVYEISSDAKKTSTRKKQGLRWAPCFYYLFSICVMEILPNALSPHKQAQYVYSFVFFGEWHIELDGQDAQLQPQEDLPLRLSEIIL